MARIVHVILDQKFIDNAISIFDRLPGIHNEYLLVSRSGNVSSIAARERITIFRSQSARLRYIFTHPPDILILHSLFFGATLVPFVSRGAALVWVSWGQDLYKDDAEGFISSYPLRYSMFKNETRKWMRSRKVTVKGRVKKATKAFVRNTLRSFAIRRITHISTCLPYEYPLIQRRYPHLKRFDFDYVDNTAVDLPRCNGLNILIGNSASINCNHLDIIKTLADLHLPVAKAIVPLSYAGGEEYRAVVIHEGKRAFGERFLPLLSFLGIDEYTRLLRSCGTAIMGFLRQQATKNIQLLLYQGTKIFFYKDTDIFRYFKASGYFVFSIEDDLTDSALRSLLADNEVDVNRKLLARDFDFERNFMRVEASIRTLLAERA